MATSQVGDFLLLSKLGEGGMGAVYKARQVSLDRVVALKILTPQLAGNDEFIARFQREARATAKLNHPHIIAGFDVGQAAGYHYFAMEFIEGESLKARIKREGALPEAEVLRIGAAVASALAHAHAAGIVHRDVKPDNILLAQDGTPKLADLGLVKAAQEKEDGSLTKSGATVGTPHYIAPEQARGERDLDGRADTYALGCTLYHAATGQTPFDGATTAVIMVKHLNDRMPHPRFLGADLSDGCCAILARMLARDREDRYEDLQDAAADMELVLAGQEPQCGRLPAGKLNFLPIPGTGKVGSSSRHQRILPRDSTSKLESLGDRDRKRARPVAARFNWWPFAAGGAAVAVLAFVFTFKGSSTPPPKPPEKPALPGPVATEAAAEPVVAVPAVLGQEAASGNPQVSERHAHAPVAHGPWRFDFNTPEDYAAFARTFVPCGEYVNFGVSRDKQNSSERWTGMQEHRDGRVRVTFKRDDAQKGVWGRALQEWSSAGKTWTGDWTLRCKVRFGFSEPGKGSAQFGLYFDRRANGTEITGCFFQHSAYYQQLYGGLNIYKQLVPNVGIAEISGPKCKAQYKPDGVYELAFSRRGSKLRCEANGMEMFAGEIPAEVLDKMNGNPFCFGVQGSHPELTTIELDDLRVEASAAAPVADTQTVPPPAAGTDLFNGRDLSNWKIRFGKWRAENGLLYGQGEDGNGVILSHRRIPQEFDLSAEFTPNRGGHMVFEAPGCTLVVIYNVGSPVLLKATATGAADVPQLAASQARVAASDRVLRVLRVREKVSVFMDGREVIAPTATPASIEPFTFSLYCRARGETVLKALRYSEPVAK